MSVIIFSVLSLKGSGNIEVDNQQPDTQLGL